MNLKQIIEKNGEATTLNLYGRECIISSEKKIYAQMYQKYKDLARKVANEFEREYSKKYDENRSIEYVRDDIRFILDELIMPLITEIRGDLVSIKIYDYTDESIAEQLFDIGYFEEFETIHSYVSDKIDQIDGDLYAEKSQREIRKENRDRWEVSTFGGSWGDAIGNQVQASAINALSGIGHSIVNSVGNSMSESEARKKKERLYTEQLKQDFVQSVYIACLNVHLFVIQLLEDNVMSMEGAVVSGSSKEKALKIIENYRSLNVDDDTALDMLQEAIKFNPFSMEIYEEFLERFGDINNELVNYGNCFNVDIKSRKEELAVEEYEEKIDIITDEDELKSKENEVIEIVKSFGLVYEESEVYELYHEKLEEMDLEYRTVDDIVFAEREEASVARQELSEITKLISDIGKPRYLEDSYEECLNNTLTKIEKLTTKVKEKYEKKVKELLKEYDLNYRKVDDILFDTREEANLARSEKAEIEKIMPDISGEVKKIDEKFENDLIEKKDLINKYQTDIKKEYISQIDAVLKKYDIFYRTLEYSEFEIEVFDTREEADTARKELNYIRNITSKIKPPTKESLFDYKESVETAIKDIKENTTTIVKRPYIELLNSYVEEFNRLYLKTGAIFKSKSVEDASKKKFKDKFNFAEIDLSSYNKIDSVWKNIDEYIVKLNLTRQQLVDELKPMYLAESRLNTVDGCELETREMAAKAKDEFVIIQGIMNKVTFSDTIDVQYENEIINALEEIRTLQTVVKDKYINMLSTELSQFDVRYKTVDSHLFNTREEANEARKEFQSILQVLEGVNPPDKSSMLDYEEMVKEKLSIIQSNYKTIVVNKYIDLLQKYLADFDVLFRKVSLFGDNTREDAAQKRLKTEMSRLKFESWEDVDNAKALLDDLTAKLGIDRSLVPEYDKMIENKEINLKTIDGIYFDTREAADIARQEYASIQELLSDVKPPKKTDLLEYEWKVKEKIDRLNNDYNTIIKDKYIEMMNKYLVSFDEQFCQLSMFKKGTRTEAAKAKAVKFAKDAKLTSTIDVENTRKQLINLLPNLGLQREDIVEAEQYLDQKREEIVNGVPTSSGGFGKFGKFFKK